MFLISIAFFHNRNANEKVLKVIHLTVLYSLLDLSFQRCEEGSLLESMLVFIALFGNERGDGGNAPLSKKRRSETVAVC